MKRASMLAGIVLTLTVLTVISGCGGGGGTSATPKQVVEKYMDASLDKDAQEVYSLLSEADKDNISLEDLQAEMDIALEDYEFSYTIGEEKIDGDEASVEITLIVEDIESGESEEVPQTINLVKEDGEWRIYFGDSL